MIDLHIAIFPIPPSFIVVYFSKFILLRTSTSVILIESILITAIAGYVGLLIGVGVLELVAPALEEYFIKDPGVSNSLVIGATLTLITAGAIAGYLPAKKASRIKPIVALRND